MGTNCCSCLCIEDILFGIIDLEQPTILFCHEKSYKTNYYIEDTTLPIYLMSYRYLILFELF